MRKFIVISIVLLMLAGFAITSSAQSAILIVKIADTEAAAPGETVTVTYNYTVTNTGDCILYGVSLVDNVVGPILLDGLTDQVGDGVADDLAVGAEATGTADYEYEVTFGDPEWLENTATASGTDEFDITVYDEDSWKIHTMGARTIGYWKNHEDWCGFPDDIESIFYGEDTLTLLTYFPGNGIEVDGVNPLEMLRVQLLAAELNIACFDDDFDYDRYEEEDIDEVITKVEDFLNTCGSWPTDKKDQRDFRKANADELALKDVLDTFNNMGDEIFEYWP